MEHRYSAARRKLDHFFAHSYSPDTLIALLDRELPSLYEQDAGVWEKYTVRRHTLMVLGQFEKYFASYQLPARVDKNRFRLFLALHDIGKPIAISKGNKATQHIYTWRIMEKFYAHISIEQSFIDLSRALLHHDLIGAYLRDRRPKEETETRMRSAARSAHLAIVDYFQLLQIYYKVDAGSYTANAGGKPSLDALFEFDEETPELRFAPDVQKKIDLLSL